MARKPRLHVPGGFYYVMLRGNGGQDIFFAKADLASSTIIDPTRSTVVENTTLGASLQVFSEGAFNPDGTLFTGAMTISGVPIEQATALLPPFVSPCNLVSIEPAGITFDSLFGGATITLPNLDNLPSGTPVDIWTLDPATGTFFIVDDRVISSGNYRGAIPFSTLVFAVPRAPNARVSADHNGDNATPTALADGNLLESFSLPKHRRAGRSGRPRSRAGRHHSPSDLIRRQPVPERQPSLSLRFNRQLRLFAGRQRVAGAREEFRGQYTYLFPSGMMLARLHPWRALPEWWFRGSHIM